VTGEFCIRGNVRETGTKPLHAPLQPENVQPWVLAYKACNLEIAHARIGKKNAPGVVADVAQRFTTNGLVRSLDAGRIEAHLCETALETRRLTTGRMDRVHNLALLLFAVRAYGRAGPKLLSVAALNPYLNLARAGCLPTCYLIARGCP
jgi:hypothetical protein